MMDRARQFFFGTLVAHNVDFGVLFFEYRNTWRSASLDRALLSAQCAEARRLEAARRNNFGANDNRLFSSETHGCTAFLGHNCVYLAASGSLLRKGRRAASGDSTAQAYLQGQLVAMDLPGA